MMHMVQVYRPDVAEKVRRIGRSIGFQQHIYYGREIENTDRTHQSSVIGDFEILSNLVWRIQGRLLKRLVMR
jgi:hypothetical protein